MPLHNPAIPDAMFQAEMLRRQPIYRLPSQAGWTEAKSGTGAATAQTISWDTVQHGTDNSGYALLRTQLGPIVWGVVSGVINYSKSVVFGFDIWRFQSGAGSIGRVQLKTATTEGALTEVGIGLRIADLTVTLETFKADTPVYTALGNITANYWNNIQIIHTPGVSTQVYRNGAAWGSSPAVADLPAGNSTTSIVAMLSMLAPNPNVGDHLLRVTNMYVMFGY